MCGSLESKSYVYIPFPFPFPFPFLLLTLLQNSDLPLYLRHHCKGLSSSTHISESLLPLNFLIFFVYDFSFLLYKKKDVIKEEEWFFKVAILFGIVSPPHSRLEKLSLTLTRSTQAFGGSTVTRSSKDVPSLKRIKGVVQRHPLP